MLQKQFMHFREWKLAKNKLWKKQIDKFIHIHKKPIFNWWFYHHLCYISFHASCFCFFFFLNLFMTLFINEKPGPSSSSKTC